MIEHQIVGCSFLFGMLTCGSSASFIISCFMICTSACVFSLPFFPPLSFILMKAIGFLYSFVHGDKWVFSLSLESSKEANLRGLASLWEIFFSSSSTSNCLCIASSEILKVVLIVSDLTDILGLKDEWINNFAECCWISGNAISILANWIENEILCLKGPLYPFVNIFFFLLNASDMYELSTNVHYKLKYLYTVD